MPAFSATSRERLATCHPLLQRVMKSAIVDFDFTVLCGTRGKAEQAAAYAAGNSKLQWPNSKHNSTPSMAVDVAPWPIDWKNHTAFRALADVVRTHWAAIPEAEREGYELVWGGGWARFPDMPHWELRKKG